MNGMQIHFANREALNKRSALVTRRGRVLGKPFPKHTTGCKTLVLCTFDVVPYVFVILAVPSP